MYKLLVKKTSQNKRTNKTLSYTYILYLIKNNSLMHSDYIFSENSIVQIYIFS